MVHGGTMKKITAGWIGAALLLVSAGCGDSRDAVMADSIAAMKEMGTIMKGITDEASAMAAEPKVDALVKKMEQIARRGQALATPTKEQVEALTNKYRSDMQEAMTSMMPEVMRMMTNPKLATYYQSLMQKFGKAMIGAGVGPSAPSGKSTNSPGS
jgi:hypothetical protein